MSEWKKVKLGECCEITSSKRIFLSDYVPVGIPFYRSKEIAEMQKGESISDPLFISNDKYEEIKCKFGIPQKGDLLLTAIGTTLGIPFVIKNNLPFYFKDGNLIWFKNFNDLLDSSFLYTWMCSSFGYQSMQNIAIGSAQKALTISALKDLSLIVPPIDIQHHIATILSRYDSLIENYQKQIKLLEEAAQRLYKEWFVDLHFPGHENTKIVDGVPEGWEKKPVKTIIELQSGYAFKSSAFMEDGIYKIVTIKNVKDGAFDGENVSKIASIPEKMPKHCILEDGDILLSLTGNVGRVCIVNGKNYLLNQRVAKLKSAYKAYTYCLFRSRDMFIEVNNLANGAAQQNVSPIRIGEMKILIPEKKWLDDFERTVSNYILGIITLQSQIRFLTEARDRLLPKLMSGEIAV